MAADELPPRPLDPKLMMDLGESRNVCCPYCGREAGEDCYEPYLSLHGYHIDRIHRAQEGW
jgi:hypothetical protein